MSPRATLAIITLVSVASATTGCYSTWDLTPHGVLKLDGFREGQEVQLKTADNEDITFRHDSSLRFHSVDGFGEEAQFRSIEIDGSTFRGIERKKRYTHRVDLTRVDSIQVKTFSPVKTAIVATVGGIAAVPVIMFAFTIAFFEITGGSRAR